MDDYLRDFVRETDDHITELNNALLELEADPDDEAAMDSIFRTAHTIKGNCGAMGFTKAADLAHAIEDLLDEIRAGRVGVTPEVMDEVFEGVDALERMIEEVREAGEPESDPREVIDGLRAVIEEASDPDGGVQEPSDEQIEVALEGVDGPSLPGQRIYHVRLATDERDRPDEGMLVLEALADAFDVRATNPPQNVIREEDYGGSFDAVVASTIGVDAIAAALEDVDVVEAVVVSDVTAVVEAEEAEADVDYEDMDVEELLESVSEYDDIDAMADRMVQEEAMDELGEAGSFEDLDIEAPDDIEIADVAGGDAGDAPVVDEEPAGMAERRDSNAVFQELREEVEPVDYDELVPELDALEFEQYPAGDELTFEELLAAAEGEPDAEEDLEAFDSAFDEEGGDGEFDELFAAEGGGTVSDDELEEVLAMAADTTAGDEEEVPFEELIGDAADVGVFDADEDAAGEEGAAVDGEAAQASSVTDAPATDDDDAPTSDDDDATTSDDDEAPASDDEAPASDDEDAPGPDDEEAPASDDEEAPASGDEGAGGPGRGRGLAEIESIRVDVGDVDSLLNQVEELVTNRIRLRRSIEEGSIETALSELDELETLTMRMQDTVMDIRLVPLNQVVGNLPRVVRDIAREEGKQVDFAVEGGEVELDRRILTELGDPLLHLVRNAVDHGIEPPEVREEHGKPPEGRLRIRARRTRDRVTIEVSDDGAGLDVETISEKALATGVVEEADLESMTDTEVRELIFEPGFSTAEEVTGVSGRGVGMDVVRETVQSLDGAVAVESTPGEGTTISLRVPVSIAIVRVLFVEAGGEEFGIPIKNVDEISRTTAIETVDGEEVLTHGEEVYPLIRLGETLEAPRASANGDGMLIRVNADVRPVAIHCDRVKRQDEVVVKPFEGLLSGIPGLSGAAVLGEGDVVNILDVETL